MLFLLSRYIYNVYFKSRLLTFFTSSSRRMIEKSILRSIHPGSKVMRFAVSWFTRSASLSLISPCIISKIRCGTAERYVKKNPALRYANKKKVFRGSYI